MPVMVFVHGGGGWMGAAPIYTNSSAMAEEGVVLVTVQYRLGLLGWLPHRLLRAEQGGLSGNYGLRDVVAALAWVRDNIEAFGGDPGSVTVFGQSFGGSMMHYLMLSPLAHSLFHKIIVESGGLDWDGFAPQGDAEAGVGEAALAALGCGDLACARGKDWRAVMDLVQPWGGLVLPVTNAQTPGAAFPLDPRAALRAGHVNAVPAIVGHNSEEGHLDDYFAGKAYGGLAAKYADEASVRDAVRELLAGSSRPRRGSAVVDAAAQELLGARFYPQGSFRNGYDRLGAIASDAGPGVAAWAWARAWSVLAPTFLYVFAGQAEGAPALAPFGAVHLLELTLLLDDAWILDRGGHGFGAREQALGSEMRRRWARFAASGRPGAGWAACGANGTRALVLGADAAATTPWHGGAILDFHAPWQGVEQPLEPPSAAKFV